MKMLKYEKDMEGKTIRSVIKNTIGQFVFVFEDNDWLVLEASDYDCCGEPSISIDSNWGDVDVKRYLNADQLLTAQLVNQPQYELLKKQELEKEAEYKNKRKAMLKHELEKLEEE